MISDWLKRRSLGLLLALLGLYYFSKREQKEFKRKRLDVNGDNPLPGPSWVPPLMGEILSIVSNPQKFWEDQRNYGPLSWNSLVGKFMVFATSTPVVRSAFSQNGHDSYTLQLHPNAEVILGEKNIAFLHGPSHKALRATFLSFLSRGALASYVLTQYQLIQIHIKKWLEEAEKNKGRDMEMWPKVRLLNTMTSQTVFLGENLKDHDLFTHLFHELTNGFLSLPINFPGTGLWKAIKARGKIVEMLTDAVASSKKRILEGNSPACLLEFWSQHMINANKNSPTPIEHSSDYDMAMVLLDFLFAAQDASTSSLDWTISLMADYPEILQRVVAEQKEIRPNHEPIVFENLEKMAFTRAVVLEMLRFRPPAPMMPFVAHRDMQLTEDYVLPKGSILMADIWTPCLDGFPNGHVFDPDRMMRKEDSQYREHYLTFGCGPHVCVGQNYAINHLTTFLAEFSLSCEWTRTITPKSHKLEYLPTVCPGDCLIQLKPRQI